MSTTALFIDLASIGYPIWHMAASDPNPNATSEQILARVRGLLHGQPYAAVAVDSKKSFRRDLDPTYKAQRSSEGRAPLYHQLDLVVEALKAEGVPVWMAEGFEADDVIATATRLALEQPDTRVLVASADKDLLALVSDRVHIKSLKDGAELGPDDVIKKFGVGPDQVPDFLCLVGDASDNVKGASKIGPVIAARLLAQHGTLEGLHKAWAEEPATLSATVQSSLAEFFPRVDAVRALIALRTDAPIPFEEIAVERPQPLLETEPAPVTADTPTGQPSPAPEPAKPAPEKQDRKAPTMEPQTTALVPVVEVEYARQLEPRTMAEATQLAKWALDSRLFGAYGSAQAILMMILAGREMGMPTMHSLRAFDVIDGKPTLKADAIRALILRSGKADYFRIVERSATVCTFATKRKGDPEVTLSYTFEEAQAAGLVKPNSGWVKNAPDMLVARASAKLARLVYPDVIHGLYAPEELAA